MDAIKQSIEAVAFYSLLNVFGVTPRQVEEQALNIFASRATAVMTNVRGPGQALYMAGSKIENIMGWVPQAGRLGLGVSIFSYDGKVSVGVITDAGLVPDPEQVTARFRARFDELLAIATRAISGTGAARQPIIAPWAAVLPAGLSAASRRESCGRRGCPMRLIPFTPELPHR